MKEPRQWLCGKVISHGVLRPAGPSLFSDRRQIHVPRSYSESGSVVLFLSQKLFFWKENQWTIRVFRKTWPVLVTRANDATPTRSLLRSSNARTT